MEDDFCLPYIGPCKFSMTNLVQFIFIKHYIFETILM